MSFGSKFHNLAALTGNEFDKEALDAKGICKRNEPLLDPDLGLNLKKSTNKGLICLQRSILKVPTRSMTKRRCCKVFRSKKVSL